VSRGLRAWIAGECERGRMRRAGSLCGHTPWSSRGGAGEGPGRENSLASLTNSLGHTRRIGVTWPVVPNYCELTAVTVFGLTTAASACRRGDTIGRTPAAREYPRAVDAPTACRRGWPGQRRLAPPAAHHRCAPHGASISPATATPAACIGLGTQFTRSRDLNPRYRLERRRGHHLLHHPELRKRTHTARARPI
jgi:hypothetical protein